MGSRTSKGGAGVHIYIQYKRIKTLLLFFVTLPFAIFQNGS